MLEQSNRIRRPNYYFIKQTRACQLVLRPSSAMTGLSRCPAPNIGETQITYANRGWLPIRAFLLWRLKVGSSLIALPDFCSARRIS